MVVSKDLFVSYSREDPVLVCIVCIVATLLGQQKSNFLVCVRNNVRMHWCVSQWSPTPSRGFIGTGTPHSYGSLYDKGTVLSQLTMAVRKELFLSYDREDTVKEFVRKLKRDLEGAQLSVWLDEEEIPAGTEEQEALAIAFSALSNCKALIAILTKNYISSTFCKRELCFACRNQKPIFPVVREEGLDAAVVSTECSEGVKYMKVACNWVSFLPSDDDGAALRELVQNVSKQGV